MVVVNVKNGADLRGGGRGKGGYRRDGENKKVTDESHLHLSSSSLLN
jgi:hypothetical protein